MYSNYLYDDVLNSNGVLSLPEIYIKFRNLMNNSTSQLDDFCHLINHDTGLLSRVLKVANSPLFGYSGKVDSIKRGILLLGLSQLHDMVLGCSVVNLLDSPNDIVPLKQFWQCSLFSGVFARLLAQETKVTASENLFLIGLLHEIGHLVMYKHFPEKSKSAFEQSRMANISVHITEQDLLGFHYGQVGARLMEKWRFPPKFQTITYYQPNPIDATEYNKEIILLKLAHDYAHHIFNQSELSIDGLDVLIASNEINLDIDSIENLLESAKESFTDIEKALLN